MQLGYKREKKGEELRNRGHRKSARNFKHTDMHTFPLPLMRDPFTHVPIPSPSRTAPRLGLP